jgi:hypothetical protein
VRNFQNDPLTCVYLFGWLYFQLSVWDDGRNVRSWAGYTAAYVLMALGVYLISDIDFLVKQGQDIQDYQEIVLSDIYHRTTIFFDPEAQQQQQRQLSPAHLEQTISKQQLVILEHSRHLGLKRGYSDPELRYSNSMVHFSPKNELLIVGFVRCLGEWTGPRQRSCVRRREGRQSGV